MKKEEVEVLEKNGINSNRIQSLNKSLKGYSELKKELKNMQDIVIKQDNEIEGLNKKIKKLERKNMLDGLR